MDNDVDNFSWITLDNVCDILVATKKTIRDKATNYKYTKEKRIDEWYRVCDCGVVPLNIAADVGIIIGSHWRKLSYQNKVTVYTRMHPNHKDHIKMECSHCTQPDMIIHIRRNIPFREVDEDGKNT